MLLQVLSDTHIETFPSYGSYQHHLTDAAYLALLGDIGHVKHPDFEKLLQKLLDHYSLVLYLLGNHDASGLSMDDAKRKLHAFEQRMDRLTHDRTVGRFVFLDRTRFDLSPTITFLGCTLYSHVPEDSAALVERGMVEFNETKGWTLAQHNAAHDGDVAWLDAQVEQIEHKEPKRSIIILSHHCPTTDARASDPRHADSAAKSAFATDLSEQKCWLSPHVSLWAWGHTHWNCDFEVERPGQARLRCFTNQRGYYKSPKASWDRTVVLDLLSGRSYRAPPRELSESDDESTKENLKKARLSSRLASIFKKASAAS